MISVGKPHPPQKNLIVQAKKNLAFKRHAGFILF